MVRTAREKRYEELQTIIKQIRNHKKIKDIAKMLTGFESLAEAFEKARGVIDKEEGGATPKFYIKCLVELEDFVNEVWEDRKNLNKNNSKSLSTMRQRFKKYIKDSKYNFETDINAFRENPEESDDEKEEEEESDEDDSGSDSDVGFVSRARQGSKVEDDDEDAAPAKKADSAKELKSKSSKFLKGDSDDESDDESDWPSSDSDESSSSSDDEKYGANPALKFLKKEGDDKKIKDKRQKKRETEPKSGKRAADDEDGEWEKVKGGATVSEKPKMFAKDAEINHQVMVKKLEIGRAHV